MTNSGDQIQLDSRLFRQCLGTYATGVTIVSAMTDAGPVGMTANSFSSLSLNPPLISWSIGRNARSFAAFCAADAFAVNILSQEQLALAQRFSSPVSDKFAGVEWTTGENGSPLMSNSIAQIECRREWIADAGDHILIVGSVQRFSTIEAQPLLFLQGRFASSVDLPTLPPEGNDKSTKFDPASSLQLFRLLFEAFHRLSDAFEEHRREERITKAQLRVLVAANESPGSAISDIVRRMQLSFVDASDAIADLVAAGDLTKSINGEVWPTDQGLERREELSRQEAVFEKKQFSQFRMSDLDATTRVLKGLLARIAP